MCFHNKLSKTATQIENRYKATFNKSFEPIFHTNGYSHVAWPVITTESPNTIEQYNWGLVPKWCKSKEQALEQRKFTLNARSETVFEVASFKGSIQTKRCLVLSDGFYEWMEVGKNKYPFHIGLKGDRIFSMAGIWESWKDSSGQDVLNTFSILTTDANPLMAKIHNNKKRMPVILPEEIEMNWLNCEMTKEEITNFFKAYPEDDMEAYTISKLITSRKENSNQSKVCEKFEYSELAL